MAIPHIQSSFNDTQKILMAFARSQLSFIDITSIRKNSFQLFSITAFLYGAINQLGKQSTLPEQLVCNYLHNILCESFGLPRHNAEGLVSSINRMMDKYYLLENIYHEGEAAAEKWLTSDTTECSELKTLLDNYQEFTMLDMNAAGMKSKESAITKIAGSNTETDKQSSTSVIITTIVMIGLIFSTVYFFVIR